MSKIKITFIKSGVSAIAELREDKCPVVVKSLLKILPMEMKMVHAKWGGGEICTTIHNFPEYAQENQTCLPSVGEILIVPQANNAVAFDIWYDRGWAFGPTDFVNGAAIGLITKNLSEFAVEAAKLQTEGVQIIKIEKTK